MNIAGLAVSARGVVAALLAAAVLGGCGGGDPPSTAGPAAAEGRKQALAAELSDEDALRYIATYSDLLLAFGANPAAGRAHYAERAAIEGRSILFDPATYAASYEDLAIAFRDDTLAAVRHYITDGFRERRNWGSFDALRYLASYDELVSAYGADTRAGTLHYLRTGRAAGMRPTFDGLRYIASYGDLIQAFGGDVPAATFHYLRTGFAQGRRVTFDAENYLDKYSDVEAVYGNDFAAAAFHFISAGYREGRSDVLPRPALPAFVPQDAVDVQFVSATKGFAIDKQGVIVRSRDAGATWRTIGRVPAASEASLQFATNTQGWVVSADASGTWYRVYRSTDGGVNWFEQRFPARPAGVTAGLPRMRAQDFRTLVLSNGSFGSPLPASVAGQRTMIVSRDSGQSWATSSFNPVDLTRIGVMWALSGGQVLRTTDYGITVSSTTLAADALLLQVSFADDDNGLVVGRTPDEVYAVWRTRDGGRSWSKLATQGLPTSAACRAELFTEFKLDTPDTAWLRPGPGCDTALRSLDGGATWTTVTGPNGTPPGYQNFIFQPPRPVRATLWMVDNTRGVCLLSLDRGSTWRDMPACSNVSVVSQNVFLSGSTRMRTADAGLSWRPLFETVRP